MIQEKAARPREAGGAGPASGTEAGYVWPHLTELPTFRALIRAIEHRLLSAYLPLERPVLDLGAGDGHFAAAALAPPLDVGVDVSLSSLREAQARGVYEHLVCGSGTELPLESEQFATAVANCAVEHIPDLGATLGELYRVLRPGGRLLITVPTDQLERNLVLPRAMRTAHMGTLATAYVAWFREKQVHYHLLSPAGWRQALADAGFTTEYSRGYMSPRATAVFELAHYGGWHNLVARRLTGRWVVWPWRPRFALTERMLAAFADEPQHADDSCCFLVARKPASAGAR